MSAEIVPIPQPKPVPLLGNLPDMDPEKGILRFMELAKEQPGSTILVNLSGRGDKDVQSVIEAMK